MRVAIVNRWSRRVGPANVKPMVYRNEEQALRLRVQELERENESLSDEVQKLARQLDTEQAEHRREQQRKARDGCALCGGTLHPVALFAGHDWRVPLPMHISTMRYQMPAGGFSHAACLQARACASCGFIHQFLEFTDTATPEVASSSLPSPRPTEKDVA